VSACCPTALCLLWLRKTESDRETRKRGGGGGAGRGSRDDHCDQIGRKFSRFASQIQLCTEILVVY